MLDLESILKAHTLRGDTSIHFWGLWGGRDEGCAVAILPAKGPGWQSA